ncbi:response regulator transcription factor [Geminocystis sp. NIES-3709]|uniref:response regulator transcription factor n=1 Tax=Geminocystis sp. NIES-3709 TaxID=1617448 RepID=UPI0005FCDB55|nr:response regulator [Geminocystis sp. NIES-3709]BAQ65441.1 chemotaxis regulator - transmits chemoreceptor signals to flagelllar motor components CheY [Geminocystis sp. NIES-3709]
MSNCVYEILLVEDNTINGELIKRLLSNSHHCVLAEGLSFKLSLVSNLTEAINLLNQKEFDAILLDLMLPDGKGIESLLKIKENAPDTPVIVQTATHDQEENIIVRAFQMGANGYLRKKDLDTNLLVYAIRLAIERQQYIEKLSQLKQQQQQQEEFASLENLANSIQPSITARMFASEALKEGIPDVFMELTVKYGQLLDLALEERAFKVNHDISEQLRELAGKLGFFKASPRDVVDIHTKALKEKTYNVNSTKIQAYVDEGRLRLLELMGYLTSYYRKYYIGLSNLNIISTPDLDQI